MAKDKLVLVDLDKTLIDESYKLTDDLSEVVELCRSKGIRLGLCSDSPLKPLMRWAEKLGFDGPIVAELGALVYLPEYNKVAITHQGETSFFSELRGDFIKNLGKRFREISIFIGDNTEFISQEISFDFMDEVVVLVSGYRTQSLAFHVRRYNREKSILVKDADLLKEITRIAKETLEAGFFSHHYPFIGKIWIDMNEKYGITIFHSKKSNKKDGVRLAMQKSGIKEIAMIGDSVYDFLDDKAVLQLAVGNASVEYKEKSAFTSPYEYTSGVKNLLKGILKGDIKF